MNIIVGKIKSVLDWCLCCSQRKQCFLRSIINGLAWKRWHASGGRNRSHSSCIHSLASLLILSWVYFLKRKECGWERFKCILCCHKVIISIVTINPNDSVTTQWLKLHFWNTQRGNTDSLDKQADVSHAAAAYWTALVQIASLSYGQKIYAKF